MHSLYSITICTYYTVCTTQSIYKMQYIHVYVPDSLESNIGPAGAIKLFVHRRHTHILPVRCLQVVQHRVAVHRVGESGHCLCNFLRVDVKSNCVFEIISL